MNFEWSLLLNERCSFLYEFLSIYLRCRLITFFPLSSTHPGTVGIDDRSEKRIPKPPERFEGSATAAKRDDDHADIPKASYVTNLSNA